MTSSKLNLTTETNLISDILEINTLRLFGRLRTLTLLSHTHDTSKARNSTLLKIIRHIPRKV